MSNQPWNPLETLNQTWQQLGDALQASGNNLQQKIEAWAEVFGQVVIPIADLPLLKPLAKIPGLSWIAATLGQVNLEAIAQTVETQRREQPNPNPEALAQQFIQAAALKAGGIGLATNFLPPLAITLFAVDMAAIATLQVELIYQMAALYDYDIQDPTRRGEVLALYACSAGAVPPSNRASLFLKSFPSSGPSLGPPATPLFSGPLAKPLINITKRNVTMIHPGEQRCPPRHRAPQPTSITDCCILTQK